MPQYRLSIQADFQLETLERILRVIRHRGFKLNFLQSETSIEQDKLYLQLAVTGERNITLLLTQLNKLIDVYHVDIQQNTQTNN